VSFGGEEAHFNDDRWYKRDVIIATRDAGFRTLSVTIKETILEVVIQNT